MHRYLYQQLNGKLYHHHQQQRLVNLSIHKMHMMVVEAAVMYGIIIHPYQRMKQFA
jgi:hypothetical protein